MNPSRGLGYLSLLLLITATGFKLLHYPGAGVLLLAGLGSLIAALVVGSLQGLFRNKQKKGRLMLLGTVTGIVLLLLSLGIQILHWPRFAGIRTLSVILLIAIVPAVTIVFSRQTNNDDNLLAFLHLKHSGGIEKYLLLILLPAVVLTTVLILRGSPLDVARTLLVLVIAGSGLHFFALNWHLGPGSWWWQGGLIVGFICFVLPSLLMPALPHNVNIILTSLFYLLTGVITLTRTDTISDTILLIMLVLVISLLLILGSLVDLNLLGTSLNGMIYNAPVLLVLLIGLFYFVKYPLPKTYLMLIIAHYLFEYPYQLGLW